MVELPKKKVGIVACSGEELAEGTVTRLAALKVLEKLRPADTVTICLPLFLAGGEGDRAFARFYPTIAIDGCELRCAARATEMYSGKPAASIVVTDLVKGNDLDEVSGLRRLNQAGKQAVEAAAERMAELVDELLGKRWDRRAGEFHSDEDLTVIQDEVQATCSCGSGIPVQTLVVNGSSVSLVGLPLIFENFYSAGKLPGEVVMKELVNTVKIYNPIPIEAEESYSSAIMNAYAAFCQKKEVVS